MKLLEAKKLKRHLAKGALLAALTGLLFFFQNCAPAFERDELGEIKMSSFDGPIEILTYAPSKVRGDFPASSGSVPAIKSFPCTVGADCKTGAYLKAYK